jgi:hypothetical protein
MHIITLCRMDCTELAYSLKMAVRCLTVSSVTSTQQHKTGTGATTIGSCVHTKLAIAATGATGATTAKASTSSAKAKPATGARSTEIYALSSTV